MKKQYDESTHNRNFDTLKYVYPVISRRSEGLSLGVNLNPDKICNFGCIYCQVNRNQMSKHIVDLEILEQELILMLKMIEDGSLFTHPRFKDTEKDKLVFKDIAFAGDGEPSVSKYLLESLQIIEKASKKYTIPKVVIISNSTGFQRPKTIQALNLLCQLNGEIWAKIDAGSQSYFEKINQYNISLDKIIDNIKTIPPKIKLQIQTCFMKVHGQVADTQEILDYKARIESVLSGREIDTIQIYTIARDPAQSYVDAISIQDLKTMSEPLNSLNVQIKYYGGFAN
ncbi:MAG: radical SAM protein [Candidatus Cloacimonetes bacterium]|nr:radical SAM protein [Candidatus Cloacimonadota bacterium]